MKIVSWNSRSGFDKIKAQYIKKYSADIYVIQECESIGKCEFTDKYTQLWSPAGNHNKGLGVFAKPHIKVEVLDWSDTFTGHIDFNVSEHNVGFFLPVKVDDKYELINCWCHLNNSKTFGYIGQLWKYLQTNADHITDNTILTGDFNANAVWDKHDIWWNFSQVNETLELKKLHSQYHKRTGEKFGKETQHTFFMHRNITKGFHIDYAYCNNEVVKKFEVLDRDKWLQLSDHIPLVLELYEKDTKK